jgi:glycosyltransferase involved in cell wall biosynthesis
MPLAGTRVIFVLGPLELGGSERQALLFARYLKNEQQADVAVWGAMGAPGSLTALCDEHNIPWRIVPFQWSESRAQNLTNLMRFARQLRRERPDVILPYFAPTNLLCNLIWRWTGARLCIWNQRDLGLDRVRSRYERSAVRQTPCFIANSDHVADYLTAELGAEPDRVHVVRNGIELPKPELDRKAWRERLQVDEDCFLACMVANLHANKDHATLLKAWRIVVDSMDEDNRGAVLVLAGNFGSTHDALKALAFDLRLDDSVRFPGQVRDIAGLLNAVDLGVFSSRSEGSPNGVLECMAAGLAIVATDIPGVREAVASESRAFLTPVADAQAMADGILKMIADQEARYRLGEANRRRAQKDFNPLRMCENTLAIVQSGLAPRKAS